MWVLFLPILCAAVFAAHLFFWGQYWILVWPILLLILLFIPKRFVVWIWQISLLIYGAEWLRTAYALFWVRVEYNRPWILAIGILGAVALLNFAAAAVFEREKNKGALPLKETLFSVLEIVFKKLLSKISKDDVNAQKPTK